MTLFIYFVLVDWKKSTRKKLLQKPIDSCLVKKPSQPYEEKKLYQWELLRQQLLNFKKNHYKRTKFLTKIQRKNSVWIGETLKYIAITDAVFDAIVYVVVHGVVKVDYVVDEIVPCFNCE